MIAWVYGSGFPKSRNLDGDWQGWGTALKPALEPITVARKPLVGTLAENVLIHGTGALNIDACRVEVRDHNYERNCSGDRGHGGTREGWQTGTTNIRTGGGKAAAGRWPANLIHDGSVEVLTGFPQQTSGSRAAGVRKGMGFHGAEGDGGPAIVGSTGSAARFFYCAKASKADRGDQNNHPTVKPTELMRHLCRLVTPPGGLVLDPFMGSGSTGKAALLEGLRFIGIEREANYAAIAEDRVMAAFLVSVL
jgi:site-specific DNA-methyltransferase (adenine-specific)